VGGGPWAVGEHGPSPTVPAARSRSLFNEVLEPGVWSLEPVVVEPGAVNPMNIQQMMKQAQQMQERLQKQMAEMRVEASAGGGMVTVVINGTKQIQSIKIDPEVVSGEDVEMLQDLIVAALNDAYRKADDEMQKSMGGMLGGMRIPGM
jgi:nucleoid-associated protein EbfC